MKFLFIIGLITVLVLTPSVVVLLYLTLSESTKGPKGEKLTDEVINAYKEQDELDKESVFNQSV